MVSGGAAPHGSLYCRHTIQGAVHAGVVLMLVCPRTCRHAMPDARLSSTDVRVLPLN